MHGSPPRPKDDPHPPVVVVVVRPLGPAMAHRPLSGSPGARRKFPERPGWGPLTMGLASMRIGRRGAAAANFVCCVARATHAGGSCRCLIERCVDYGIAGDDQRKGRPKLHLVPPKSSSRYRARVAARPGHDGLLAVKQESSRPNPRKSQRRRKPRPPCETSYAKNGQDALQPLNVSRRRCDYRAATSYRPPIAENGRHPREGLQLIGLMFRLKFGIAGTSRGTAAWTDSHYCNGGRADCHLRELQDPETLPRPEMK